MIRRLRRWYLRRLIVAGEATIEYSERQIAANRADVSKLRVQLSLAEDRAASRRTWLIADVLMVLLAVGTAAACALGRMP